MVLVAIVFAAGVVAWLWWSRRDPLLYLTPFALVLPPIVAYGSVAAGWPGGWLSSRVAVTGCLLLFVAFRLTRGDYGWRRVPGLHWLAPYIVLVPLSVLWGVFTVDPITLASDFISWLLPVVVFACLALTPRSNAEREAAVRVVGAMIVVEALYCTMQALSLLGNDRWVPPSVAAVTHFGQRHLWFGSTRVYGTLPNLGPNFLGIALLIPTVLAVARAAGSHGWPRLLWSTIALGGMGVIVATYSRGAQLGLAISLLALPFWLRSVRGTLAGAFVIVLFGILLVGTPFGRNAVQLYSAGRLDPDAQARLDVWREIFAEAPAHPFGYGFDGWLEASRHVITIGDPMKPVGTPHPADNLWVRELADRGLLGVMALALLMGGVLVVTYRASRPRQTDGDTRVLVAGVGAGSLGLCFAFISGDHLMYLEIAGLFWYMLGISLPAAVDVGRADGTEADHEHAERVPSRA